MKIVNQVFDELSQVSWSKKSETIMLFFTVIAAILLSSTFFFLVDYVSLHLIQLFVM